jgi:hypothetical protein
MVGMGAGDGTAADRAISWDSGVGLAATIDFSEGGPDFSG